MKTNKGDYGQINLPSIPYIEKYLKYVEVVCSTNWEHVILLKLESLSFLFFFNLNVTGIKEVRPSKFTK